MLAEINKRVLSQCVCKEGIVRDVPASEIMLVPAAWLKWVPWLRTDELTVEGTGNSDQQLTRG